MFKGIAGVLARFLRYRRKVNIPSETSSFSLIEEYKGRDVLDVYELEHGHAYGMIVRNPITGEIRYEVIEPTLTDKEKVIMDLVRSELLQVIDRTIDEIGGYEKTIEYLRGRVRGILARRGVDPGLGLWKIEYYLIRDLLGYGRIDALMKDPGIEDISCSGPGRPVYVWHRSYESIPTNIIYDTGELDSFVIRLAYRSGRMITYADPILEATLPDGSRIHLTLGSEVTRHGSSFSIRKFRKDLLTIVDLVNLGTLTSDMAALLWFLVENRVSVLVCGGIASGKTTMLNCLSNFIHPDAKIVTIEDTPELQLYHINWVRSVTRPRTMYGGEITVYDLLRTAMRQRPDYIIIGEVRGEEAYTLFQAIATGHLGMCTLHAESIESALMRLESPPMNIPRSMISMLDVILVQRRAERDGTPIRRTEVLAEVSDYDRGRDQVELNVIYRWKPESDTFAYTGRCLSLEGIAARIGYTMDRIEEELRGRRMVIEWMCKTEKRGFGDVAEIIRRYVYDPESILRYARIGA
ncbi:MAG: type II/IV secretion system ATPase subunit [Candidatus Bathyarchaeota archaeon]|nr:type II/IV secretion system ATPase subunit [Candidatus Bathyarchaeota archaeon]